MTVRLEELLAARTCARCGESLNGMKPQAVYCSRECKERSRWKRSEEYRTATKERSAKYVKTEKGRESYKVRRRRAYEKYPERAKARARVQHEISQGRMHRPESCQECGATKRVEAHHWRGYDHPLDVQWLCKSCHVRADTEAGHG